MDKQVEAIYENGAFRPLESVELKEHQRVLLRICENPASNQRSRPDSEYLDSARRLAKIPGSLTADFIAERGEH